MLNPHRNLVALVAGCTGGLGTATTIKLLNMGAKVVGIDVDTIEERYEKENLFKAKNDAHVDHRLRSKIIANDEFLQQAENDGQFIFHHGDVLSSDLIKTALESVKGDSLKLAVNCAGYSDRVKVYKRSNDKCVELESINHILDVNVVGSFNFSRLCSQAMAKNPITDPNEERGLIINTSGLYGKCGMEYQAHMSAAQGAINSMTLPMARDLAHCNIRAVTISTGFFRTNLLYIPIFELTERIESCIRTFNAFPNRLGEPEEFADCVMSVYDNKMLNGEVIELTAGCRIASQQ